MSRNRSRISGALGFVLLLILSPLILVLIIAVLAYWLIASLALYILVWLFWCTRGKDLLFVYSDSPIWHDYIEQEIIPRIQARAVILNWSNRRQWLQRMSLASLLFQHFGGAREFNPLAIYFQPLWFHQTFRFWKAFKDAKHGKPENLKAVEEDFFRCIRIADSNSAY